MAKLFLVRHGQSQWNLENRFTGWKDIDITEKGQEEARKAGDLLKDEKIDEAFTSALIRAQHTLQIILEETNNTAIPVTKNQALNERDYGDITGLNKKELAEKIGAEQVHIWRRSYDIQPPGGESLKDTEERVMPYFKSEILPKLEKGKNILVVAHGNSLRALIMNLENLTPDEILSREIATGQPISYLYDENRSVSRIEE